MVVPRYVPAYAVRRTIVVPGGYNYYVTEPSLGINVVGGGFGWNLGY